jgi:hypothetical protein
MTLPAATPVAVAPSTGNAVPSATRPSRGPYVAPTGTTEIKSVPLAEKISAPSQPSYGGAGERSSSPMSGSMGAPSVPADGYLYRQGPADPHYTSQNQGNVAPYHLVSPLKETGLITFVKRYMNHIAYSQRTTNTGFKIGGRQQRTSVMIITPPGTRAQAYANGMTAPRVTRQAPAYNRSMPVRGTLPYGSGVLNADTFGAGMVAGGIGGNMYTPSPSPPVTRSTASMQPPDTDMPVWG